MAFVQVWDETAPDGTIITVSQLDDFDRGTKVALRERLEGDPAAPDLTGLIEVGSWPAAPKPRKGAARVYVDTAANIAAFGATKREDGRLAISSDTKRLYHVATAGVVEAAYLPLTGGTITGPLIIAAVGSIANDGAGSALTFSIDGVGTTQVNVLNNTGGQMCNLLLDGNYIFKNNTAFSMQITGTPTGIRVMTIPDVASDTFVMLAAAQTITGKTSIASGNFKTTTANPSTVGVFRLANSELVSWRNQANTADLGLELDGANDFRFHGNLTLDIGMVYKVSGTQVVAARIGGYVAFIGTNTNRGTAYDTATITLVQLAERVRALQVDLTAHGLIGA